MTSEKFEELADLIADKAAQKIINMNGKTISDVDKNSLRMLAKKEDDVDNDPKSDEKPDQSQKQSYNILVDLQSTEKMAYNQEKKRFKESKLEEISHNNHDRNTNKDFNSEDSKGNYSQEKNKKKELKSLKQSNYGHAKHNKISRSDENLGLDQENEGFNSEKKSENIDKIDTQTFLENHMASKELELNFKHLKGKLDKHRFDVKENNLNIHRGDNKNKRKENNRAVDKHEVEANKIESIKKKLKEADSKELILSDLSVENKVHEQTTYHNPASNMKHNNKSEENKSLSDYDTENKKKRIKKIKYDYISNEKPVPRIINPNSSEEHDSDDVETAKAFIDKVMDRVSRELNSPSYRLEEVLNAGSKRSHVIEPEENIKVPDNSRESIYRNKTVHGLDKQNLYNLRRSAESYIEYHDNLAAQSQQLKFINTYK